MNSDLKESLMIVANRNINEYDVLKKISVEDFIIKYKIFVDEIKLKEK